MKGGDLKQFQKLSEQFSLIPLNGKRPIEENWQRWCVKKRPFNPNDFKGRNAGIACGPASGSIFIDVDDVDRFNKMVDEKGWELPQTLMHMTGAKKPHFAYAYPNNGKQYGIKAVKDKGGNRIFEMRGIGAQVVAPGSIHPDTGKPYTVRHDLPMVPIPEFFLSLYDEEEKPEVQRDRKWEGDLASLPISLGTKKLIKEGESKGDRSEAIFSVLLWLLKANIPQAGIFSIFETHPIGQKYREKGNTKQAWLQQEIDRAKRKLSERQGQSAIGMTFEQLKREFSGKVEWLWREHIPKAIPSMINGREGTGKTTLTLQIAKEILETNPIGIIVWLATEGFVNDTVVKMEEMGITNPRFQIARKPDGTFRFNLKFRDDCIAISNYLNQLNEPLLLVVVDSLRGATDFDANEDKMRLPMINLNTIVCDRHKAACVWIHHWNKTGRGDLLDKSAGSPAITAAVRQVLSVTKKSGYVRLIRQAKSNIGISPELELIKVEGDIIIRSCEEDSPRQCDKAEDFLIKLFKDRTNIEAVDAFEQAERLGIKGITLKRAKKKLDIESKKINNKWFWYWRLQS